MSTSLSSELSAHHLMLGDKQYTMTLDDKFNEQTLTILIEDAITQQQWSVLLDKDYLATLPLEIPRKFAMLAKIVKKALTRQDQSNHYFSFHFGIEGEKPAGLHSRAEPAAGDSLYLTMTTHLLDEQIKFELVIPEYQSPQVQARPSQHTTSTALDEDQSVELINLRREVATMKQDLTQTTEMLELVNLHAQELESSLQQKTEEITTVGSLLFHLIDLWVEYLHITPDQQLKLKERILHQQNNHTPKSIRDTVFAPLENYVAHEKAKILEAKRLQEEIARQPFPASTIITLSQMQLLNQYYGVLQQKWRLLYRASEHGFTAESFHRYCDNQGPTMIIIQSTGGFIFGGYAHESWRLDAGSVTSHKSFLFTLVNPQHHAEKLEIVQNDTKALNSYSNFGPVFGEIDDRYLSDDDLLISDLCHENEASHSKLGHTYEIGSAGELSFTGSKHFQVKEYEVYALI